MPHHSWTGTPRDHRLASPRRPRRTLAVLLAGCLVATACTDDDEGSSVAAESSASTAPAVSTTAPTVTGTVVAEPPTAVTDPPPTTEPAPARCGDGVGPSGPVTITVWHGLNGDAASSYLPSAIGEFERRHPDISVEIEKADLAYPSGLPQFADATNRPDVLYGSNLTVKAQADSGLFIPVEACAGGGPLPQFDGLLPAVDLTYRVDGTLWGAPFNVSTPLLMYDGNVWREAGIDPDRPPGTLDELLDTARRLDEAGAAETGLVLYNKSALWLITEKAGKEGRPLVEPRNGHGDETPEIAKIVTDDAVALLDELRRMRADGVIAWTAENQNDEDLIALITPLDGSAMTLHTSAALGEIFRLRDGGTIDVDVRVAPMPGPGPGANPGGGSWWLTDGDDPDRVAAAWRFIDWMTQPEQIAELAAFTGYVPTTPAAVAHPTTVASWEQHPQMKIAYEQVAATPGTPAAVGLQVGPMVEFLQAIEIGAASTIDTGNDPRTELENAAFNAMDTLRVYSGG